MFKKIKQLLFSDDLVQVWLTRKQLEILHKLIKENEI
mgnify:CR=1 FL=1